jgi:CRISPR-associated protein (TIGR03986 family)
LRKEVDMPRQFFINPYTFIPLDTNGPILKPESTEFVHLLFDSIRFTGTLEVEMTFITPAVIPGKQIAGSEEWPGAICAYRHGNHLAIPGSRIRGHLLNLMRSINSSPIVNYEDRVILGRDTRNHKKGVIIQTSNGLKVREIRGNGADEILVAHSKRTKAPRMADGAKHETDPRGYDSGGNRCPNEIPDYGSHFRDDGSKITTLPVPECKLFFQNTFYEDRNGKVHKEPYKAYLAKQAIGTTRENSGNWVKFNAWSGQDELNRLPDLKTKKPQVHLNAYHIVKADWITPDDYPLAQDLIDVYDRGTEEAARLLDERGEAEVSVVQGVRGASPLKPGMFVYFELDDAGKKVRSIGRHYRYLFYKGSVASKVIAENKRLKDRPVSPCAVTGLSGYANEEERRWLKGQIWVGMALGPELDKDGRSPLLQERDLRILSSQPPKAFEFYLKGGDYNNPSSRIRGRKFYWHDPLWNQPMWDNSDLGGGEKAFDNPDPEHRKLWKQWSCAEVLMPTEDKPPLTFNFTIRLMNASDDELYLLLTAILGFSPEFLKNEEILCQENPHVWCHKVGHARPFMGSAFMRIKSAKRLDFDTNTLEPRWELRSLSEALETMAVRLKTWQSKLNGIHLDAIKRVMQFAGAREGLSPEECVPITYPLGQDPRNAGGVSHITWKDREGSRLEEAKQPKTYAFFARNPQRGVFPDELPDPSPGVGQKLPVKFGDGGPGAGRRNPPGRGRGGREQGLGNLGNRVRHGKQENRKRRGH